MNRFAPVLSPWTEAFRAAAKSAGVFRDRGKAGVANHCCVPVSRVDDWLTGNGYPSEEEYIRLTAKVPRIGGTQAELRADRSNWSLAREERERRQAAKEKGKALTQRPFASLVTPTPPPPVPDSPPPQALVRVSRPPKKEEPMTPKTMPTAQPPESTSRHAATKRLLKAIARLLTKKPDTVDLVLEILAAGQDCDEVPSEIASDIREARAELGAPDGD